MPAELRLRPVGLAGNVFSNWFGLLFSSAIAFFLTPVLINGLGEVNYGLWALITAVIGYYGLLDAGTRTALFRFVARFKGAADRRELDRTFTSALALTLAFSSLTGVLSLVLAFALPGLLKLNGASPGECRQLLLLLGPAVGATLVARFLTAYLNGLGRFDMCNLTTIAAGAIRAVFIIAALRTGRGVLGVGAAELAAAVVAVALKWWMVLRVDPALSVRRAYISAPRVRELVGFSLSVFLSLSGDYLRLYSGPVIIGRFLSVALLTPFSIATRLLEFFRACIVALVGPIMGAMCELDGQRRQDRLQEVFLNSTRLTMSLSLFAFLIFLIDGKMLIAAWVGERFAGPAYPVLAILAAGYLVAQGQHATLPALMARGAHPPIAALMFAEGLSAAILGAVWASNGGLAGIALGAGIPMLAARTLIQPWYALRALNLSARRYLVQGLGRPLGTAFLFLAAQYAIGAPTAAGSGIFRLACIVACQTALFGSLAVCLILTRPERRYLARAVKTAAAAHSARTPAYPGGPRARRTGKNRHGSCEPTPGRPHSHTGQTISFPG